MTERPAHFVFSGRLSGEAFAEFARHRAARLSLDLDLQAVADDSVSLTVFGDADLVDAFEMACSLGPYACIVLDVVRSEAPARVPKG